MKAVKPKARKAEKPRRAPATVLAHADLLAAIADATAAAGDLETGGPLIGTVQRSWSAGGSPRLLVSLLATVPPGPALRAHLSSVSLGHSADGERAASAIRWWRAATGLELLHLGDWHKHHSVQPQPSSGDRRTARRMCAATPAPIWLAAISVGEHDRGSRIEADGNRARVARSDVDCAHVRFYRAVPGAGLVKVRLGVETDALPSLPPLSWHVADPARFAAECRLLKAAGFTPAIDDSARKRPGLALRLDRNGKPPLTVVTGPGFPVEPPVLRNGSGRRVRRPGPWSADRFIVDLVGAVR